MSQVSGYKKIHGVLRLKCPNCGKAKVFYRAKFPYTKPAMKDSCEACGYRFDREPGFYRGAMALSLGFALLEGLVAYNLAKVLIFGVSETNAILLACIAVLICAVWNYKLARVVWLNVFPA
jgi:predicted RNA-binding Zn-ribbon protein involved in translation (DUF1610 family)